MFFNYLVKRLLWLLPTVLGVVTLVFFLIHCIPGDPVDLMLGESAQAVDKEVLRRELGLDKPVVQQYIDFLSRVARADLGRSLHSQQPVLSLILKKYPATLELMLAAIFSALLISLPLGITCALKHHSLFDQASLVFSLIGVSMPNFWLGPLLIILFSLKLGWLPICGRGGIRHLLLPAITLGVSMSAILTRMVRSSLLDVLEEEYVVAARAKGLPYWQVILKHALKNALIPVISIVGLQIGALLTGSIITEMIFAWPGLGRLTIQAIYTRDYPLVQGCVLVVAMSYVLVNLLTDLAYTFIDPRIRFDYQA
ncbi:MAG: ABC transporter permease [bacterium]|nr:ABC transporter permease [bacterium]